MKPIIKIENLSKQYRLGAIGTGTLSHDLNRWWHTMRGKEDPYLMIGEANDRANKGNSDYVWAMQDINLEVQPGEVLGIIGKNGAGKSTLLKLLSRVTAPTTGSIKTRGRMASLLEVGTGFHPELTGRENIFLNGAILGMSKKEIASKFDEIVDFAGCERYIDTPVKRYSSGMYVRLAFAVAAHLEPEILIVDEVLAVGDAEFQKKAIGKMKDVSTNEGRTVLFVSHNMGSIKKLCTRAVILEEGKLTYSGNVDDCINKYLSLGKASSAIVQLKDNSKDIRLKSISLYNSSDINTSDFTVSDEIHIKIDYEVLTYLKGVNLSLGLKNSNSSMVLRTWDIDRNQELLLGRKAGKYQTQITIPKNFLNKGTYTFYLATGFTNKQPIKLFNDAITFNITYGDKDFSFKAAKYGGIILQELQWITNKID